MFGDQYLETDEGCSSNPSYVSNYDYYRGEAPFSENEISIISKLMLDYDFILCFIHNTWYLITNGMWCIKFNIRLQF